MKIFVHGFFNPVIFFTEPASSGGKLDVILIEPESIKIRWEPPPEAQPNIQHYVVSTR